ncbi:DNA-binding NarL/FixJ family response regulator [Bradyrhizobium sp. S3.9.2]|uniref:hypothetical protein n=1 Tax=unclassified Bradyrhizobium TaxID=2631580 RepID=UPI003397B85B
MSNNRQEIRPWSPEEEAQLLALHDEGMTATELGERLGRSRQAVKVGYNVSASSEAE